jgi:hypothetical protein
LICSSVLEFWKFDPDLIRNDSDIHATVSKTNTKGILGYNVLNTDILLGGIERNESGYVTKAGMNLFANL